MVADSAVVFMSETDSVADTLVAQDCYWYLDDGTSEDFLNTMLKWTLKIRPRLDPDSTQYDVWPVQTSDTSATYYRMTRPDSIGRALAVLGESSVDDGRREKPNPEADAAGLVNVVPAESYLTLRSRNPVQTQALLELGVARGSQGTYQIEVFGVTGRRVAIVANEPLTPGTYRYAWSGADVSGTRVASGIYFIRVQGPGVRKTQKVTLLR